MLSLAASLSPRPLYLAPFATGAASMGILDDAIREHLDLKRQVGARDAEIKALEDEAFGPPARPGEPEFGDSEETDSEAGSGGEADAVEASSELADAPPVDPDVRGPDEQLAAEQARLAHPELEDTQSHAPFAGEGESAVDDPPATEPELEASSQPPAAEVELEAEPPAPAAEPEVEAEPAAPTAEPEPEPDGEPGPRTAEPELDAEDFDVGDLSLAIDDEPPLPDEETAPLVEEPLPTDCKGSNCWAADNGAETADEPPVAASQMLRSAESTFPSPLASPSSRSAPPTVPKPICQARKSNPSESPSPSKSAVSTTAGDWAAPAP